MGDGQVELSLSSERTEMNHARALHLVARAQPGLSIGRVTGFTEEGQPCVLLTGASQPLVVLCTASLSREEVEAARVAGWPALILHDEALEAPILLDFVLRSPRSESTLQKTTDDAALTGRRIEMCADEALVLRCGDASITLERDGRVVTRGNDVLSRSRGVNRLRGAAVKIN